MKQDVDKLSEKISQSFKQIFSKEEVNLRAKKRRFTKRETKKLTGYDFLLTMTLGRFKKCA